MPDLPWYLAFAWGRAPYALDLPEVVIGRGEGCSLQIDEAAAGDEHARFVLDDEEQVSIEDLGSGKPTLVNGRAIAGLTQLRDGDFIQIGSSVLTLRRQVATAAPDARTVQAEAPEAVKRVVSAKNFVVGEGSDEPQQLATLMMESPLAARPQQRTVEANVDELMASIRRNTELPQQTVQMPAVSLEPEPEPVRVRTAALEPAPTLIAPSPQRPQPSPKSTLIGVGVADLPGGAATMMMEAPKMEAPEEPKPEELQAEAPHVEAVAPLETTKPVERADIVGDDDADIAAQPTRLANVPSQPNLPVRRVSQTDITPLPAPLPPPVGASIQDLAPYVARATGSTPVKAADSASFGSASTMALPTTHETALPLGEQKTMLPTDVPLAQKKTMLPMQAPLHEQKTQAPMEAPRIDSTKLTRTAAPPTERVKPIDAKARVTGARQAEFTPPEKGPFGSFSRAFDFFQQMYQLARSEPVLMKPLVWDLALATALSVVLSVLMFVLPASLVSLVMLVGVIGLYFVDYFCNALAASLLYDYATGGTVDLEGAKARVKRSLPGIATFAAISGLLDFATTYARERNDFVAKIVLGIIHAIWTTATYVIMPAMIIEGVSFKDAFARSKALMDRDPTGVGAGIVALSLTSYVVGAISFALAVVFQRLGNHLHPAVGMLLFFLFVNAYWAVSGWMKISYSTCFYMWAQRCEAAGHPDTALAPMPLRHAIAAG